MAKVLTLQQKREAAMAANLEIMKQRLAEIEEQKRLYNEQEAARIAALTPEEKAEEEAAQKAHQEAVRQIQIETAERRASAVEPRHSIIHLQDEE